MRWGSKEVNDWKQPNVIILWILSFGILFVFPLDIKGEEIIDGSTVLVGNQQTFGLQTLVLAAKLYKKTGKWPRSCLDSPLFKIPIAKHLIEYLGCCKLDTLDQILKLNGTTIVYPGGWREQLKSSKAEMYKLDFEHAKLVQLVQCALQNEKRVLPIATVGIEDMLQVELDVPMPYDATFPIIMPTSYQKQYCVIGKEVKNWDGQVTYIPLLKSCFETVQECKKVQKADDRRFPLEPLWKQLNSFKEFIELKVGGKEFVGQTGARLRNSANQVVTQTVEKILDRKEVTNRRVTIEELE